MDVAITPSWQGPTRLPEGLTVVGSAAAWERVRAAWNEPLRARVDLRPAWDKDVILVIAGAETGDLGLVLRVSRAVRTGDDVAMDVAAESRSAGLPAPSAMNHPTLIVTAPAEAFARDPSIALSWNGKPWGAAVRYER
ncbi:MAG TPA: hypothetical protein VKE22_09775 [Haliangiales bacterium]|nr:hypothetical protein [Haliangiales bacterium]